MGRPPKLTAPEIEAIRRRYAEGDITQRALAREFGISSGTIGVVVRQVGRYAAP